MVWSKKNIFFADFSVQNPRFPPSLPQIIHLLDLFLTKQPVVPVFGPDFAGIKSMKQVKKGSVHNQSQKKRIIQWEIPHLISVLKKEQGLSLMHMDLPLNLPPATTDSFVFNGHIGFPLFMGVESLGFLVCFNRLNRARQKQIRHWIDKSLQKALLRTSSDSADITPSSLEQSPAKKTSPEQTTRNKPGPASSNFPMLIRGERPEEMLKTAHKIYLKTPAFAFVNAEDLKWKEGLFQNMKGVFVCVPFFHRLSSAQRQILRTALSCPPLPCRLVMGVRKQDILSDEWQSLFHPLSG